jgi:hypothetical protein
MQARLPQDKLHNYRHQTEQSLNKRTIRLRDLKSVIGQLNFATTVIPSGRAFLRRLHNLTIGITKPHFYVTITENAKKDLQMWLQFLNNYNGITIIHPRFAYNSQSIKMCSDSSKMGYGATYGRNWIEGLWPPSWTTLNIAVLELYPVYLLLAMFAHKLRHSHITFYTDNQAIVYILNKQSSKCNTIMSILRPLVLLLLHNNIILKAAHIPGIDNTLCDFISRQKATPQLLNQYGMSPTPTPIPPHLKPGAFKLD